MERLLARACISGSEIHVGEVNNVLCKGIPDKEFLEKNKNKNLYWLQVDSGTKGRAEDSDVTQKNYCYFDFDIRKTEEEAGRTISDEEIKTTVANLLTAILEESDLFRDWGDVVFTGNGLHVYYWGDTVKVEDHTLWSDGLRVFQNEIEALTDMKGDKACVNVSRIARLPDSVNQKGGSVACVLKHREVKSKLLSMIFDKASESRQDKIKSSLARESTNVVLEKINSIPIGQLVATDKGWDFDGKNFHDPGSRDNKGCFVSDKGNFLVHEGTPHISNAKNGYNPFSYIKEEKKFTDAETYKWFKERFPEVRNVDEKFKEENLHVEVLSIRELYDRMKTEKVEFLKTGYPCLDNRHLFLRSAVTRVAAWSNIGKSKFAYWVALGLAKKYSGIFFSTEVRDSIVLRQLVAPFEGVNATEGMERNLSISDESLKQVENLRIVDSTQGATSLSAIEAIADRYPVDFIIVDYVQGVSDKKKTDDNAVARMENYAREAQQYAQKRNIAYIDLSQVNNEQAKGEFDAVGFVGMKHSGDLFCQADMILKLTRDKVTTPNVMKVDVAKHKYGMCESFSLDANLALNTFAEHDSTLDLKS